MLIHTYKEYEKQAKLKTLPIISFICLCSVITSVCYSSGNTKSKVDYVAMLNELSKNGRDESLNAEPFYKKAAELYVELPEEVEEELLKSLAGPLVLG